MAAVDSEWGPGRPQASVEAAGGEENCHHRFLCRDVVRPDSTADFFKQPLPGRLNNVPIIDEWCCGYIKGIALDPEAWQPLIKGRPDWFEVMQLYGTQSGWERLKELVEAHPDLVAGIRPLLTGLGPPRAISMPTGSLAARLRTTRFSHFAGRRSLAAMSDAHVVRARSSSTATVRRAYCTNR
jgi:hypothetical protein